MAVIPKFFFDAVVAIGVQPPVAIKKTWIGSGFLVGRPQDNDPQKSTVYLITNKHVVENGKQIIVKFNSTNNSATMDYPVDLSPNGSPAYSVHPTADIIAMQINPNVLSNDNSMFNYFNLPKHSLNLSQMRSTGVGEGSLIYALGFPMNLVNDRIQAPICRLGCIARIADAFSDDNTIDFLVDCQTFPGNSGDPIINRPEIVAIEGTPHNNSANLIGILHSYITYQETLVSTQTKRVRVVNEENSGLTMVHPVDRIKEVVELEYQRTSSQAAQQTSP